MRARFRWRALRCLSRTWRLGEGWYVILGLPEPLQFGRRRLRSIVYVSSWVSDPALFALVNEFQRGRQVQ